MYCARLAFAAIAVGSLAVAGCQTVGPHSHGGFASNQASHQTGLSHAASQSSSVASQSSEFPVQQVGYTTGDGGGCSCSSCSARQNRHSCNSCGTSCGGNCGRASGGLARAGGRFCGCGKFSFSIFGSKNCARCGNLRGGQCGRCGIFGIFNGSCGGCGFGGANGRGGGGGGIGGRGGTPYTPPFAGPAGPMSGAYAYPYYTVRGPRDFFMSNPPPLGR